MNINKNRKTKTKVEPFDIEKHLSSNIGLCGFLCAEAELALISVYEEILSILYPWTDSFDIREKIQSVIFKNKIHFDDEDMDKNPYICIKRSLHDVIEALGKAFPEAHEREINLSTHYKKMLWLVSYILQNEPSVKEFLEVCEELQCSEE